MREDSLNKRYIYKISGNLVGLLISLITQAIIPRGLGPKSYGNFSFLSNFFNQITSFLEMGTSICFYTKLCQRSKDFGLVSYYFRFSIIISVLLICICLFAQITSFYPFIWPGQQLFFIYLAAVWGVLTWGVTVLNKMADAYGLTVYSELTRIYQKIFGLLLLVALFFFGKLNLTTFFFYHFTVLSLLGLALIIIFETTGFSIKQSRWCLSKKEIENYTREFYYYSSPLFIYALVSLFDSIFDRWLLQRFAGSVQQGFFGLSYQIGAICLLFTTAMTPLIMREFSIVFEKNDLREMARLFRRYIPMLYAIAAYFACFLAVQADKVAYILGGEKFDSATLPIAIMVFYPIHQTYGQLSGSVFLASGQTKLYRNIGIFSMFLFIPITFFLIAPREYFGLNAGATGLAIKMVGFNILYVNLQLFFNSRFLKLNLMKYLAHQVGCVGILLMLAFLTCRGFEIFFGSVNVLLSFIVSGFIYTCCAGVVAYAVPIIFGLNANDIKRILLIIENRLRK